MSKNPKFIDEKIYRSTSSNVLAI